MIAAKLQGKDAHRLSMELGRAMWEREESLGRSPRRWRRPRKRAGLDAAALRAGGPSDAELDALYEQYTQEALTAERVRRAELRAAVGRDSSGARTGWNCWSAR